MKTKCFISNWKLEEQMLSSIFDWIMEFATQFIHTRLCPCLRKNRTGGMHPITFTSGHLPDNFIWWHFRTVGWLGYVKVALLVKHVNVVLPQSSCWCSSINNWGLMNRGHKKKFVCSLICYNLFPELYEMWVPLPSDVVLWRLHLQLICSLSLFFVIPFLVLTTL